MASVAADNEELITVSKREYDALVEDANTLSCLYAAGVNNWDGYDYAMEMIQDNDD